jgi:hypothetical protein
VDWKGGFEKENVDKNCRLTGLMLWVDVGVGFGRSIWEGGVGGVGEGEVGRPIRSGGM